jgi:hypothetical protein
VDTQDLLSEARERLIVDWVVVTPREGRRIDVGEEFDVQLSVRNGFSSATCLAFQGIDLILEGSRYAEPVGEPHLKVEETLDPGGVAHAMARFRALAADPLTEGTTEQERIGRVRARAQLVLQELPSIETTPRVLTAQIHDGSPPE